MERDGDERGSLLELHGGVVGVVGGVGGGLELLEECWSCMELEGYGGVIAVVWFLLGGVCLGVSVNFFGES